MEIKNADLLDPTQTYGFILQTTTDGRQATNNAGAANNGAVVAVSDHPSQGFFPLSSYATR